MIEKWIAHWNKMGGLSTAERELRREACERRGFHRASPEAFMTADPIHTCADCLTEVNRSKVTHMLREPPE